ncbi:hypothetical protein [Bacteroides acidifaciens]|uniref:Uncharacterized protein n=2 Tax=Bacteroides acidifaciens TaxID=85831 RepID=A0A4S2B1I8_9BACE|nr:hypothetical protein [Bacteroides acidifaciens]TGY06914.1 hypothetical protein E5356_05325 [Bacteroides acidifaciens]
MSKFYRTAIIKNLEEAIPLMEQSLEHYRKLVELTDEHYLYVVPLHNPSGWMVHKPDESFSGLCK